MCARGASEVIIDQKEDVCHLTFVHTAQWKGNVREGLSRENGFFDDIIQKQPKLPREIDIDRG